MALIASMETRKLSVGYPGPGKRPHAVVEGIDISLRAGEFVCLLGPNGAGKSTLIRTLSGMLPPLAGTVSLLGMPLAGCDARALARHLGLVLTDKTGVGLMRVFTLVSMGRHPYTDWRGRLSKDDQQAVWRAIREVGVEKLANRAVCELSDGEKQKVMIARALAQEPEIMILDEATAFLDLPRRVELMHLLRKMAQNGHQAILLSTHDLDLALRYADRLWLLPPGGPLMAGIPEDMVLSDAFGDVFSGPGIHFDKGSGAFTMENRHRGSVGLNGNGVCAMWTYRALERTGYRVDVGGQAKVCVKVMEGANNSWVIRGEDGVYFSLEDLLAALARHHHAS